MLGMYVRYVCYVCYVCMVGIWVSYVTSCYVTSCSVCKKDKNVFIF